MPACRQTGLMIYDPKNVKTIFKKGYYNQEVTTLIKYRIITTNNFK